MNTKGSEKLQNEVFDLLLKGNYGLVLPLARELYLSDKENSEAIILFAWALLENNDPVQAEILMNKSEELSSISTLTSMCRAYLQMRLSNFEESVYNFNMVEGRQKQLLAYTYLNKAKALASIGDIEKANNFYSLALMIDNNSNPEWKKLKSFFKLAVEFSTSKFILTTDKETEIINSCKQALIKKEYWFSFIATKKLINLECISEEIELLHLESMMKLHQFIPAKENINLLKLKYPYNEQLFQLETKVNQYFSKKENAIINKNNWGNITKKESKTEFVNNDFINVVSIKLFDFEKDADRNDKEYYSSVDLSKITQIGLEVIFNNKSFNKHDQSLNCFLAWYINDDLVDQSNFNLEIPVDYDSIYFTREVNTRNNKFWVNGNARLEFFVNRKNVAIKEFTIGLTEVQHDKLDSTGNNTEDLKTTEEIGIGGILAELNNLIGLENVKGSLKQLIDYLEFIKERKQQGLKAHDQLSVHSVFVGNAGTGKTTVARLLGKIFKSMGLLPKGDVIEVDRSSLVGQYIGETAQKTEKIIEQAIGNVLFIDEAYTLSKKGDDKDFGHEAIDILLKRMEDKRGEFVVIVAGYPKEMDEFLDTNPGLKSRFNYFFNFEDYQPEELSRIFNNLATEEDYRVAEDANKLLLKKLTEVYRARDKNFGNARSVRKYFEDAKIEVSKRYLSLVKHNRTPEKLTTIYADDINAIFIAASQKSEAKIPINEELLKESLAKLEELNGLNSVKKDIKEIVKLARYYSSNGDSFGDKIASHILFLGNPGTGKTTVARIISQIYKALSILPNGQLIEVDRAGLVSNHVGETAQKTNDVILSAMGGTLFIDEAYSLAQGDQSDFGKEAINTLLKRMEDDRGKFIVIAAGYSEEMKSFIDSNSGIKSRFSKVLTFEDYNPEELMDIFNKLCKENELKLDKDSQMFLSKYFVDIYRNREKSFGNARVVRNVFDAANKKRVLRLAESGEISEDKKSFLIISDFEDFRPSESNNKVISFGGDKDKLDKYIDELKQLTGLDSLKENVTRLISSLKISKLRLERGMEVVEKPLHTVFTGNPGTGKTTVARIMSNIFKELGVLEKGHLVEVERAQLVAGYTGQTAIKTDEIIKKALGGTLFIDEAYTLAKGNNDFGQEAIETLLKRMEDFRGQFVVIVAGYEGVMKKFMDSNPGLSSRFSNTFNFEDYTPNQLLEIVKVMAKKSGYVFENNAILGLINRFEDLYENRDQNFGNARTVRNILLEIISNQEERIACLNSPTDEDLITIKEIDVLKKK